MNARSMRRRLMKSRARVFWGARSFLSFRIPLSLFPERPPVHPTLPDGWKCYDSRTRDAYLYRHDDGTISKLNFFIPSSGQAPNPTDPAQTKTTVPYFDNITVYSNIWVSRGTPVEHMPAFITPGSSYKNHYASESGYKWIRDVMTFQVLREAWEGKYCYGYGYKQLSKLGIAIRECRSCSSASYIILEEEYVDLVFTVKWYHPKTKLRFCAAAARLYKTVHSMGAQARVWPR